MSTCPIERRESKMAELEDWLDRHDARLMFSASVPHREHKTEFRLYLVRGKTVVVNVYCARGERVRDCKYEWDGVSWDIYTLPEVGDDGDKLTAINAALGIRPAKPARKGGR